MASSLDWLQQMLGGTMGEMPLPAGALADLDRQLVPGGALTPPQQPQQTYFYPDVQTVPFTMTPAPPDTGQGTALEALKRKLGDIGTGAAGLAERFNLGAMNLLDPNVWGGGAPRTSTLPVAPGAIAAADALTAATGGLTSSLYPAAGALRAGANWAAGAARANPAGAVMAAAAPFAMLADDTGTLGTGLGAALALTPRQRRLQELTLGRPLGGGAELPDLPLGVADDLTDDAARLRMGGNWAQGAEPPPSGVGPLAPEQLPHAAWPPEMVPAPVPAAAAEAPQGLLAATPAEPVLVPGGKLKKPPMTDEQRALVDTLRAEHLATPDALPFAGKSAAEKAVIVPPQHIQTQEDLDRLVRRYVDMAKAGAVGKPWYDRSGAAVLSHAGTPEVATPFAAGIARTSPQTDVASNFGFALKGHNQALVGDPIKTGRFPNAMGSDISDIYYGGEKVTGEKIGPFMGAIARQWDPVMFPHTMVNDIWNMRLLEYPGSKPGELYSGSPSLGNHNFARVVADRAAKILREETGEPWTLEQVQASSWTGIKREVENTSMADAAFDFSDALKSNYAQLSWESAPGVTTGHFPELHQAPWALQQQYHDDIQRALTDDQGRDIIASHLGMLTGRTFQGPGYFKGKAAPGSQTPIGVGGAPGGALQGVDPASKELLDTANRVRGILLRQDAMAWHKPLWAGNVPVGRRDLFDVTVGRPLTPDETVAIAKAMQAETGSDFFSPLATSDGFRFQNVPDYSGRSNKQFVADVNKVLARNDILPDETVRVRQTATDGNYEENNWSTDPDGQSYRRGLGATRSPDLQRRAAELLATLGPRTFAVDERYARTHGWTLGPQRRYWEEPAYQAYKQDVIPNRPKPGELRPLDEQLAADPDWKPLFGPGSALGGLLALLAAGGGAQNAQASGLPPPPRNSLDDIMRMLGGSN